MPYAEIGIVLILGGVIFWAIRAQIVLGRVQKERDFALAEVAQLRKTLLRRSRPRPSGGDEQSDWL